MVQDGKTGLTEAIVTGPGLAVLFYGQQSLGEGLSLGKFEMPCLHSQLPSLGLANQPNSVPSQQAWVMVSS